MKSWIKKQLSNLKLKSLITEKTDQIDTQGFIWEPGARFTAKSYASFVKEGFSKNPIVYRCVSLISRGISSVPLEIDFPCGVRDNYHPILNELKSENLLERLAVMLLLSGKAPLLRREGELALLNPDRVHFNPTKQIYTYDMSGKRFPLNEDFCLLKLPHPLSERAGFSPLEAASIAVDQHNAVSSHNLALLQNGGRPLGALIVKTPHNIAMKDVEREKFKDTLQNAYMGPKNAGRILLLEGNMEWQEMGKSLKDLDFVEGKRITATEIALCFGVPPMLVGVQGEATFANYKEARFHLWEDTILPLLNLILNGLNDFLRDELEDGQIVYDLEQIPALSQRREGLWERVEKASFLNENEKRELLGFGAVASS